LFSLRRHQKKVLFSAPELKTRGKENYADLSHIQTTASRKTGEALRRKAEGLRRHR